MTCPNSSMSREPILLRQRFAARTVFCTSRKLGVLFDVGKSVVRLFPPIQHAFWILIFLHGCCGFCGPGTLFRIEQRCLKSLLCQYRVLLFQALVVGPISSSVKFEHIVGGSLAGLLLVRSEEHTSELQSL